MNTAQHSKPAIIAALREWIAQRPGLQFANYGSSKAYSSEYRAILRDRRDAETLLAAVATIADISGNDLAASFRAFSGRLSWNGERLEYVTGQYWPTEYRKAVCAVAKDALWNHFRKDPKLETGQDVRRAIGCYLRSPGVASRWFN
jgi:hypothetical protein